MEADATTLDYDRTVKLLTHDAAGIAVSWIVNFVDRQIEVYSDPTAPVSTEPDLYRRDEVFGSDAAIDVVIGACEVGRISATDLLP